MTAHLPPAARQRADTLLKEGRPREAIPLLRELVRTAPGEDSHLLSLAWALHESGQPDEAADCFERLFDRELSRRLFTGFAYDELVRIYREGGHWDKLLTVCKRAAVAQPEDTGLLFTLGEAFLFANRPDKATEVFEKLTTLEADHPEHWRALGNARLAAGDPGEAEAAYLRAADLDPAEAPNLLYRLADRFLHAGYLEKARIILLRCLALRPDEPLYLMALGDVLIGMGKWDAAAEAYTRAAALHPSAAGICWNRLGNQLTKEGLPRQAAEAFRKAVTAEPGNPRYLLRLAAAYVDQGLTDDALATLRRVEALTAGPKPP